MDKILIPKSTEKIFISNEKDILHERDHSKSYSKDAFKS